MEKIMEDLKFLALELYALSQESAQIDFERDKRRKELFAIATREVKYKKGSQALPTKSVELPEDFLETIGLSENEFFDSRYPGWIVMAKNEDVYVLMKDPQYLPWEYIDPESNIKVARQIQESTPAVDWDTLKKEDEFLFTALAKPVVHYELNEENYNKLLETKPEFVSVLQRHLIMKKPVQRLPKPVKVEDDDDE